jgi:hypothetical protein
MRFSTASVDSRHTTISTEWLVFAQGCSFSLLAYWRDRAIFHEERALRQTASHETHWEEETVFTTACALNGKEGRKEEYTY